ncbi:MAG: PAS domain-containing protein [Kiritimatiellales bacterium]|nr:PAS domain-containing protein [Kiritimatiellales bacterium]
MIYLLSAVLWIFFSDLLMIRIAQSPEHLQLFSTGKGWFFVLFTASVLFIALYRIFKKSKRVHDELLISEARFDIAASVAGIGVWDRDVVNNRLIWDERMCQLYGLHATDFDGAYEAWEKCVHPDDRQAAAEVIHDAEINGKEFNTEFRIIRPDGEIRYIRAFGKVIRDDEGSPRRMIGVNYDITPQKLTEQQIQSQLKELDRWHQVTLGRETRVVELKKEINEILRYNGQPLRYKETGDDPKNGS